jgi:hypothetical protein
LQPQPPPWEYWVSLISDMIGIWLQITFKDPIWAWAIKFLLELPE